MTARFQEAEGLPSSFSGVDDRETSDLSPGCEKNMQSRYFFNVHNGTDVFDNVGLLLDNERHAYREAIRQSGTLLQYYVATVGGHVQDWRMEVLNETGNIIAVLRFSARGDG